MVWKLVKFYSDYDIKNRIVSDFKGEHPMFEPDGILDGLKLSNSSFELGTSFKLASNSSYPRTIAIL